jgi:tetratricopeptide (TPR) repeat protein
MGVRVINKDNGFDLNMPREVPGAESGASSFLSCSPDHKLCRRSHLLSLLLLFLLLLVIYFNSFSGIWIFDDAPNIVENRHVHLKSLDWDSIKGTFYGPEGKNINRPLSYLSFGLNYYFHELNVFGYHLVNFIIHCLTTLFLYLFIFHTLHLPIMRGRFADRAGSIALLAAALWATSPIQVTAVTVIVQRMASMAGMFFIMAMYFYLVGRITPGLSKKITWFSLCGLSGLLSLASKENAAMLPVVLYLFDLLLIQGVSRERLMRHLLLGGIPLIILAALAFALTNPLAILSGYDSREFTLLERLLTQPRILLFYLSLMLYPMTDRFTLMHEITISTSLFSPWTTLPAIVFWTSWTALGVYWAGKRPLISFCLLFFVVNHLIESSFIPLELIYEHRNYIPSMSLFILLSVGIIAFIRDFSKKRLLAVLASVVLCITIAGQGYSVVKRNILFGHALYLWFDNAEKAPGLSRVHTNLGQTYEEMGMDEEARKAYLAAIVADRYDRLDARAVTLNNMGNYYARGGDLAKALDFFKQALAVAPEYMLARHGMATAQLMMGDLESARLTLEEALGKVPKSANFLTLYSFVLLKQNDYHRAVQVAKNALDIDPRPSIAHQVLGEAHTRLGQYIQAQKYWHEFAHAEPRNLEALLAIVHLADLLGDEKTLRKAAVRIVSLKGDIPWDKLFEQLRVRGEKNDLVFEKDPMKILPLVRQALEKEITEIPRED